LRSATKKSETKKPVSPKLEDNKKYIEQTMGLDVSFDAGVRELVVLKQKIQIYYVNSLVDMTVVQELMKKIVEINDFESNAEKLPEVIENRLVHLQVEKLYDLSKIMDQVVSGLVVILIDGVEYGFAIDTRNYPGRTPEEPDTEKVIRGARDGYTENIIENAGLTRRKLRDYGLRNELMQVGRRSKTDICVSYINDIANQELVDLIKRKLKSIDFDGIMMQDKALQEFLIGTNANPYPTVRYTERPDTAASHLLEGHVLIIVDTSPSVMILPATFFHHVQHAEEYRQNPVVGTFMRFTRFLAVFASLYLLPVWLMFHIEPDLLPQQMAFIGPQEEGNVPIFLQMILAIFGLQFLRLAAIHTPTALATSMGLIAAVLIGQIAIDVGLLSAEVILYASIASIGSYVTPSYELSVANQLGVLFLLLMTGFFGSIGFVIGVVAHMLYLVNTNAIKTPYLWPFIPFNFKAMANIIIRIPVPQEKKRPSIVHSRNNYRQPVQRS